MIFNIFAGAGTFWEKSILFVIVVVALIFSLTLHELGHGLVAHWCGDDTAKVNGRLSLNPMRHLDPVGTVMLLLVGFGYAKPVPVNPANFKHYRRGSFCVAIAGVSVNLLIAFFSALFYNLFEFLASTLSWLDYVSEFFFYMLMYNLVLCFFNLLPLYPLDGFRIIESFTKYNNKFTMFLRRYGNLILILLIGIDFLYDSLISMYPQLDGTWFYCLNPLGLYFDFVINNVSLGFMKLWGLLF